MSFEAGGYGEIGIGWGRRPAIIVVDFQLAFTDPAYPLGRSSHIHAAVERTADLVDVGRRYADVVDAEACKAELRRLAAA